MRTYNIDDAANARQYQAQKRDGEVGADMEQVLSVEQIGSVVHRVRQDAGISRAELASRCDVGTRTLFALEKGGSDNIGFSKLLSIVDELGMSLFIGFADASHPADDATPSSAWTGTGTMWQLPDVGE